MGSKSLQLLLQYLIPSNVKQLNIGQCIAQASRPRSIICPVLFGLGVQVEKSFASKWLVNHLYRLGYSISYDEVLRFKHSVIDSSESPIPSDGSFCQWVADNVDHNQVTLTGKGTFHGMSFLSVLHPQFVTLQWKGSRKEPKLLLLSRTKESLLLVIRVEATMVF